MGTVWAMKALSVEVQFSQSITFHSLLPFLFLLALTFSLTHSLSPDAAAPALMPGFTFQHRLSWETSSHGQGATQIKTGLWLALLGLLRFPVCPCAPSTTSPEGIAGKCYTPPFIRVFCLKGLCVMGLDLDSVSFLKSSAFFWPKYCFRYERALLIRFKLLFHSPIGIQDGCYEPLNPTANSGEKLNGSAHALTQFYNSWLQLSWC